MNWWGLVFLSKRRLFSKDLQPKSRLGNLNLTFYYFWNGNVVTVSYTHLDVYKRQRLYIIGSYLFCNLLEDKIWVQNVVLLWVSLLDKGECWRSVMKENLSNNIIPVGLAPEIIGNHLFGHTTCNRFTASLEMDLKSFETFLNPFFHPSPS